MAEYGEDWNGLELMILKVKPFFSKYAYDDVAPLTRGVTVTAHVQQVWKKNAGLKAKHFLSLQADCSILDSWLRV